MGLLRWGDKSSQLAAAAQDTVQAPSGGTYLTDGATLFCVGYTLSDEVNGELFIELEDCGTAEVVLCPARAVSALGLQEVTPSGAGST